MDDREISNITADAPALIRLKERIPQLRIWTPSCRDFEKHSAVYIKGIASKPLAIIRPQSENEVAAAVAYANEISIPVAIRAGGHDFLGRSMPQHALVLDMRDMKNIEIVENGHAAIIGGGILAQDLADALGKTGHATAFGASSTVGYVGWSTHGGYGPFSGLYGLGADQILGARVVDYRGEIFDASDELLYGVRGAGSAFGVIVSLKIKVYKLEKIFAGTLIFSMGTAKNDLDEFLRRYQNLLDEGIPKELGLDVGVCNIPNAGKALFCSFMWASTDLVGGRAALEKMQELGPIAMNTVSELPPSEWLRIQDKHTPPYGVYVSGGPTSVMVPSIDECFRNVLVKYTKELPPNPATLWVEHHLHGAALEPELNSCFAHRQRHLMVEIIGTSVEKAAAEISGNWAVSFHNDARQLTGTFQGGYIVLTSPAIASRLCYPGHWERLQQLKSEFDPQNRFCFTVTGLGGES